MMRRTLLASMVAISAAETETTLIVTAGMQTGFFKTGGDIGSLNPHDYRPNEFVTNDFIYEGLTAWDGEDPDGQDGVSGTSDDFVAPSLAASWETNLAAVEANHSTPYEITFYLQPDVTFHDGSPWNAAAAQANFDQIMGGYGTPGGLKAMTGMHDWIGFTQSLDSWEVVDDMTFKLTFFTYYEAALRELTFIRPFRMISLASFPDMAAMELSHNAWRNGKPRTFKDSRCNKTGIGVMPLAECQYTMRGVGTPLGTGPYKVVDKLLRNAATGATRRLPASEFNASCYEDDTCTYNEDEYVAEVLFQKFAASRKNPTYDNVIMRSYDDLTAVTDALEDGSLDIAYGVQTLSSSAFISIAAAQGSADESLSAFQAHTDLNTRLIVLNSGAQLDTIAKRKLVMGILAPGRQELYDGELAEETPMDTLFDPALPHCGVLSDLSTPEELAADTTATAADIKEPLRFMYLQDRAHVGVIAAQVIRSLYEAGIEVKPIPVDKATYNSMNCNYLGNPENWADPTDTTDNSTTFPYYYSYPYANPSDPDDPNYGIENNTWSNNWHSWDIAYSETWGPPYDATSKLWDMTHGLSGWCSGEADAPAVSNMEGLPYVDFVAKVRSLSNIIDHDARDAAYTEVLTALHDEAIFLPITAKLNMAAVNRRVSGFEFGYMEFDLPLAPLYPTPPSPPPADDDDDDVLYPTPPSPPPADDDDDDVPAWAIALMVIFVLAFAAVLMFACALIRKEKKGTPMFVSMGDVTVAAPPKTSTTSEAPNKA